MNKRKIKGMGIFLVAIMLLTTASAVSVNKNGETVKIKIDVPSAEITSPLPQGNVRISSDPLDEKHPAITKAPDGSIIVAFDRQKNAFEGHIYFMRSTDNGNTWSEIWNTDTDIQDMNTGLQNWPVLCLPPGGKSIYGAWNDEVLERMFFINITDASTPQGYEGEIYYYDASGWDYDRSTFTIAAYDASRFAVGHVGHIIYAGYDLPSSCQIFWFSGGFANGGITGDEDYPVGYNNEVAVTKNLYWMTFDFPNKTTGKENLLIKWGDPEQQSDCHFWDDVEIGSELADYKDPAMAASGESVCIVYMSNENAYGDFDLVCRYTTDEGATWHESKLPSLPQVDEKSPEIFMSGSTVLCAFVRNNNLYFTKSDDYGATWDEPIKVNDVDGTVVDEPGAVDISPAGIVWVDTRNGNEDIYYSPLPAPLINIEISGGFGIKATVSNNGIVEAKNLEWSIDLSGLVFIGKHSEGTIDTLSPGESVTIGPGFVFGVGPVTITVKVDGITSTAKGMAIGPFILGVS